MVQSFLPTHFALGDFFRSLFLSVYSFSVPFDTFICNFSGVPGNREFATPLPPWEGSEFFHVPWPMSIISLKVPCTGHV